MTNPVEALKAVKATLERENMNPIGSIRDTIWHGPGETLFDFIDNTIEALSAIHEPTKTQGGEEPVADVPSAKFIEKTNREYVAWCKKFYQSDALDECEMKSLHGLWAWQEQERRYARLQAALSLTDAARDVLAERKRQIEVEGWTAKHDDEHEPSDLALAASAYALDAGQLADGMNYSPTRCPPYCWPWAPEWWKSKDERQSLVKSAALALAAIERFDRAALSQKEPKA